MTLSSVHASFLCVACCVIADATAVDAAQVRRDTGVERGLVVCLGTVDGRLEAGLAAGGATLVHGLALDAMAVDAARAAIAAAKATGLATVIQVPGLAQLPYNDHLVNVVVADLDALGAKAPSRDEILRVVRPLGAAYLRQGGTWQAVPKPMPKEMDDWTHYDQGPEGNPQSRDSLVGTPRGVQWQVTSGGDGHSAIRLAGGHWIYGHRDPTGRKGGKPLFSVRDAFNGLLLWRREEAGDMRRTLQDRSLAADDRIIVGVIGEADIGRIVDAASGRELAVLKGGVEMPAKPEKPYGWYFKTLQHLLINGTVVQAGQQHAAAFDPGSAALRWRWQAADRQWVAYAIAGDGRVYLALSKEGGYPGYHYGNSYAVISALVALDLASGKELWTNRDIAGYQAFNVLYADGAVFAADANVKDPAAGDQKGGGNRPYRQLLRIDAATGRTAFTRELGADPLDKDGYWHNKLRVQDGLMLPTFSMFVKGYDARTGQGEKLLFNLERRPQDTPLHCSTVRGTANGFVAGKFSRFVDVKGNAYEAFSMGRSSCDQGSWPGYGMIFSGDHGCGCTSFLRGHLAMHCVAAVPPRLPDGERLERGQPVRPSAAAPGPDQWPMLFAETSRGAGTATPLAAGLQEALSVQVPVLASEGTLGIDWRENTLRCGPITPPVIADGLLVVASTDAHQVHAFDAQSGAAKWTFTAGGRIDSSPTLYRGLCLFGSNDGHVYAVRMQDGALAWRFLAAPARRHIVVSGQVESLWPVHGTVLVREGKAFVAAGRHNQADGGIALYRLDAVTGALEATRTIFGGRSSQVPVGPASSDGEGKICDILATNIPGTLLYCGPIVIDPVSLHWANLTTMSKGRDRKDPTILKGEGSPDITATTPALQAFIFAGSSGAIHRQSARVGVKGASGFRYQTTASWTGSHTGTRMARSGRTLYRSGHHEIERTLLGADWVAPEPKRGNEKEPPFARIGGLPQALIAAGDQVIAALADGKGGGRIVVLDGKGATVQELALKSPPVLYGLAAAYGRLYVACEDGTVAIAAGR